MHDLKVLREKCERLASSFEHSEYRAEHCGDGYEVTMRTPSCTAVYRGPGDECWEWLRGTSNGRLLGRGSTMEHDTICDPRRLAPTGRGHKELIRSAKRIWTRSNEKSPRWVGKSPAGPFLSFFDGGNDTCDNVYAFLCGTAAGLPQGEFEGRIRPQDRRLAMIGEYDWAADADGRRDETIRRLHESNHATAGQIAVMLNISKSTVYRCLRGTASAGTGARPAQTGK